MSSGVFEALNLLEKEWGISVDSMLDKIKKATLIACKDSYDNEDALINMDAARGNSEVFLRKMVVEQVEDPGKKISLTQAREIDLSAGLEDKANVALNTREFGRIAAQTARNIIRQGIRDGERGQMIQELQSKNQELTTALVERIDSHSGAATPKIGKAEAVLPKSEQAGDEQLCEGDHIKVYVVDVKETEKGPRAMISHAHPGLVKCLFKTEAPEIYSGVVGTKVTSREAGSHTKLAMISHNPDVDAVGAHTSARGVRVSNIVTELGGEKIDIVEYSDDPVQFTVSALSSTDVLSAQAAGDGSCVCRMTVPDSQLSFVISNKGQNARLATKLTGWKTNIKPESGFHGEEPVAGEVEEPEDE